LPTDDPPRRRPDISLARQQLDWSPRTDLDTGLMMTIRDVEERLQRGDPTLDENFVTGKMNRAAGTAGVNAL
jgi:hypothetical protein